MSERTDRYLALHEQGLTASEIARETGVSVSAVAQWLRSRGLKPHGRANIPDSSRQILGDEDVREASGSPGYLVSRSGIVYSTRTDPPTAITPRSRSERAPRVMIPRGGRIRYCHLASLVLESWGHPRPEGYVVEHRNGDPQDCRLENLHWRPLQSAAIDRAEFVRTWQSSLGVTEVSERLGISLRVASALAEKLRRLGIPLKRFSPQGSLDVEALRRLAAESCHPSEEEEDRA